MASSVHERMKETAALGTEIPETGWAYQDGVFKRLADAHVSLATHALNYGTGVFEGIRAYWNATQEQLYVFRLREHFERMRDNCRLLRIELPGDSAMLSEVTLELLRKNEFRTDVYIRPLAYKAARSIKVALPARGKLTGAYINTALAVDEAHDANADESIFLTRDGHVSEGGSANLFMVRGSELITPSVADDILEGITRETVITIAREELGLSVTERAIDRTELFIADEVFFCGTGAQVAPCVKVDGRDVGDGTIGPVARRIGDVYFAIARGDDKRHAEWRTAVHR